MNQDPILAAFSHLLITGTLVHEASFSELQEKYNVHIHPHLVMVVSVDRYPDLVVGKSLEWRIEVGTKLVEAIRHKVLLPHTWIWIEEGVLALLVESEGASTQLVSPQDVTHRMVQVSRAIQQALQPHHISVSIGIGTYYDNPYQLHLSFKEAVESMSGRFFQGNGLIFQYGGEEARDGDDFEDVLMTDKTELLALVRIGDEQGVALYLPPLLEKMAEACQHKEDVFKSDVVDLVMMISRLVVETGVSAAPVLSKNTRVIQELYDTIRYDKFVKKVIDYVEWLTSQVEQNQTGRLSPAIRQAIRYLKRNHRKAVSLEEVARFCCVSKYHLSHLFKKEVGVGVIEYLNHIRVEKAVFYVKTTDLSIQQVASQVGFQDANYFSRIFKRYTKYSPTEYRTAISCEYKTTNAR
jgi:two-component system response regulator YesN